MHKLIILSALVLIALACGGGEDMASEAPPAAATKTQKEVNVKKLWKVNCITCHGARGDMGVNGAANLQESDKDLDYRINIITNGSENGVMVAYKEVLEPEEIEALAKYTMEFRKD